MLADKICQVIRAGHDRCIGQDKPVRAYGQIKDDMNGMSAFRKGNNMIAAAHGGIALSDCFLSVLIDEDVVNIDRKRS